MAKPLLRTWWILGREGAVPHDTWLREYVAHFRPHKKPDVGTWTHGTYMTALYGDATIRLL